MKDTIYGKKVTLRPLRNEDADFFAHWYSNPKVMFQCGFYEPTTPEAELKRIQRPEENDESWYAVVDKETGNMRHV